jgi:hypothetical protein
LLGSGSRRLPRWTIRASTTGKSIDYCNRLFTAAFSSGTSPASVCARESSPRSAPRLDERLADLVRRDPKPIEEIRTTQTVVARLDHAERVFAAHEGVPLIVSQCQLGHSNLGITSIYLQGIDNAEIIEAVQHDARRWSRSAPRYGFDGDAAPRAKRSRGDGVAHDRTYV